MPSPIGYPFIGRRRDMKYRWGEDDQGGAWDMPEPQLAQRIENYSLRGALPSGGVTDLPLVQERQAEQEQGPGFLERLGSALEGAALAQPFDARSESFGPAFLGTALNTYAGISGMERQREEDELALYRDIMAQAHEQQIESQRTAAQIGLWGSQEARNYAQAAYYEGGGARGVEEPEPNLEALATAIEDDYPQIAQFIRDDPRTASRAPGTLLNMIGEEDTPDRVQQRREERAANRYYQAEGRATSDIAKMQRSTNPLVLAQVRTEEQRGAQRESLTRGYDPSFVQDSIIANRIMQGLGGGELPEGVDLPALDTEEPEGGGYQPPKIDTMQQGAREGQGISEADAELGSISEAVRGLTIEKALEVISNPDITPPFTAAERKSILLGAGFTSEQVDKLVTERTRSQGTPAVRRR
ncbi:MAG: hypothetical protein AMS20_00075 [Gemmatimonas sp. SG8_28]|nr:MAG: hypothetical protein AMS20_00075 [Gemmatimonas sp. SG8_28]